MVEKYYRVEMVTSNSEEKDILIALLSAIGYEGFEEEKNTLKAYIEAGGFDEMQLQSVTGDFGISYTLAVVENKNWNEVWESSFEPVIVENFCAVRAGFHAPVTHIEHEVIITPKMSFGTGHHATTYMMILAMRGIEFKGKAVFDFGTGTGVLAILAEKCGASRVDAIDNDEWSINNAKENVVTNHSRKINVERAETLPPSGTWDIMLANINRNVILENLHQMTERVAAGGLIVLSGLLASDETEIAEKAAACKLILNNKLEKHNWICLTYVSANS